MTNEFKIHNNIKDGVLYGMLYFNINVVMMIILVLLRNYTFLLPPLPEQKCIMNVSEPVNSTRRDVVLFFTSSLGRGLTMSLISLRSTGSKCRIMLFITPSIRLYPKDIKLFNSLEVEIVKYRRNKNKTFVPHMLRYECEQEWLSKNINDVDRVLHSDAFDVFFQGDPFSRHISHDSLTFVVEPHQFRSCGWNLAWISRCYGESGFRKLSHRFIICSGSIAGPAKSYLKLIDLMIRQKEWDTCFDNSLDQPILNYLVWRGYVSKAKINYTFSGCTGGFFTAQWCILDKTPKYNKHNQVVTVDGDVPSFIHQYNRFPDLTKNLFKKCRY